MATDDRALMRIAARAAARGAGRVEPNPMVGCVVASPDGRVLGVGHHRRFGGPHAEVEALAACRANGHDPRGATAVVTLEPCNHHGKTGPCTEALIGAGIRRVVYACRDPHEVSSGGTARLRGAGVEVEELGSVPEALHASAPFRMRIAHGRPWFIAKWAQTIDGKVASRTGSSQWISGPRSRARVHRLRGRVDAVVTGIGTVERDDPMLTARDVTVRRIATRIVVDSRLRISMESKLVRSAREAPVVVVATEGGIDGAAARVATLRDAGVEVVGVGADGAGRVDLRAMARMLKDRFDSSRVLVEAGPGLVGGLMSADLVDEVHAYIAPMVLGDPAALGAADVGVPRELADANQFSVRTVHRCGDDVLMRCVRVGW